VDETDNQQVIDSHVAEITEYDLEEPCGLSKPEDTVVDRLQLV